MLRSTARWFAVAIGLLAARSPVHAAPSLPIGRVASLEGGAEVWRAPGGAWAPLAATSAVYEGDTLHTQPAARLKVRLDDGSVLALGGNGRMKLTSLLFDSARGTRRGTFDLLRGKLLSVVAKFAASSLFEVRTETAIIGVRGTTFLVDAEDAGGKKTTEVTVVEGSVGVKGAGPAAEVLVPAGQTTRVVQGGAPEVPHAAPPSVLQGLKQDAGAHVGGGTESAEKAPPPAPIASETPKPGGNALDVLGTGVVGGSAPAGSVAQPGATDKPLPPIPQQPPPPPIGAAGVQPVFHQRNP